MKVNTQILKNMLSKVGNIKANNLLEITQYYELDFNDNTLTINATDGVNFMSVSHETKTESNMKIIVKVDQFTKLINRTTKDTVELTVKDNYLEVKGNGTYKVEIVVDEVYPTLFISEDEEFIVDTKSLSEAIKGGKNAKGAVPTEGILYSYLVRDSHVLTANGIKVYGREIEGDDIKDLEILIPPVLAGLIHTVDLDKATLITDKDKMYMKIIGQDVTVTGALADGVEDYPALDSILNMNYEYNVELDVKELLNALDRLNLFTTQYDKGILDMIFSSDSITLATSSKSIESIPYLTMIDLDTPLEMNINGNHLRDLLQSCEDESVMIGFGDEDSIKLSTSQATMALALASEDDE